MSHSNELNHSKSGGDDDKAIAAKPSPVVNPYSKCVDCDCEAPPPPPPSATTSSNKNNSASATHRQIRVTSCCGTVGTVSSLGQVPPSPPPSYRTLSRDSLSSVRAIIKSDTATSSSKIDSANQAVHGGDGDLPSVNRDRSNADKLHKAKQVLHSVIKVYESVPSTTMKLMSGLAILILAVTLLSLVLAQKQEPGPIDPVRPAAAAAAAAGLSRAGPLNSRINVELDFAGSSSLLNGVPGEQSGPNNNNKQEKISLSIEEVTSSGTGLTKNTASTTSTTTTESSVDATTDPDSELIRRVPSFFSFRDREIEGDSDDLKVEGQPEVPDQPSIVPFFGMGPFGPGSVSLSSSSSSSSSSDDDDDEREDKLSSSGSSSSNNGKDPKEPRVIFIERLMGLHLSAPNPFGGRMSLGSSPSQLQEDFPMSPLAALMSAMSASRTSKVGDDMNDLSMSGSSGSSDNESQADSKKSEDKKDDDNQIKAQIASRMRQFSFPLMSRESASMPMMGAQFSVRPTNSASGPETNPLMRFAAAAMLSRLLAAAARAHQQQENGANSDSGSGSMDPMGLGAMGMLGSPFGSPMISEAKDKDDDSDGDDSESETVPILLASVHSREASEASHKLPMRHRGGESDSNKNSDDSERRDQSSSLPGPMYGRPFPLSGSHSASVRPSFMSLRGESSWRPMTSPSSSMYRSDRMSAPQYESRSASMTSRLRSPIQPILVMLHVPLHPQQTPESRQYPSAEYNQPQVYGHGGYERQEASASAAGMAPYAIPYNQPNQYQYESRVAPMMRPTQVIPIEMPIPVQAPSYRQVPQQQPQYAPHYPQEMYHPQQGHSRGMHAAYSQMRPVIEIPIEIPIPVQVPYPVPTPMADQEQQHYNDYHANHQSGLYPPGGMRDYHSHHAPQEGYYHPHPPPQYSAPVTVPIHYGGAYGAGGSPQHSHQGPIQHDMSSGAHHRGHSPMYQAQSPHVTHVAPPPTMILTASADPHGPHASHAGSNEAGGRQGDQDASPSEDQLVIYYDSNPAGTGEEKEQGPFLPSMMAPTGSSRVMSMMGPMMGGSVDEPATSETEQLPIRIIGPMGSDMMGPRAGPSPAEMLPLRMRLWQELMMMSHRRPDAELPANQAQLEQQQGGAAAMSASNPAIVIFADSPAQQQQQLQQPQQQQEAGPNSGEGLVSSFQR